MHTYQLDLRPPCFHTIFRTFFPASPNHIQYRLRGNDRRRSRREITDCNSDQNYFHYVIVYFIITSPCATENAVLFFEIGFNRFFFLIFFFTTHRLPMHRYPRGSDRICALIGCLLIPPGDQPYSRRPQPNRSKSFPIRRGFSDYRFSHCLCHNMLRFETTRNCYKRYTVIKT